MATNPGYGSAPPVTLHAQSLVLPQNLAALLADGFYDEDEIAQIYPLSPIDHLFSSTEQNFHLVFFFRHPSAACTHNESGPQRLQNGMVASFMQSLKQSLAMTLSHYPVAAGRVRATANQQGRLEIVLQPGLEHGVVFIEATAEARLDYWPDLRKCWLLMELIKPLGQMGKSMEQMPLLQIQVTVFQCGGVALGLSFAHILTDGIGAIQFLQAWGEIHQQQHPSVSPALSRSLIQPRNPPHFEMPIPETSSSFTMIPPSTKEQGLRQPASSDADGDRNSDREISSQARALILRLPDENVSDCMRDVEQGPHSYGTATAHEAMCALVWSSLMRARGWSSEDEESSFSFPVNIRKRCDPPLPSGYFGNAILNTCAVGNAKLIATLHFSYAAKLIHEAIKRHTPAFCQSAVDAIELQLRTGNSLRLQHVGAKPELAYGCTSFEGIPVYAVSFGWGEPVHVAFIPIHTRPQSGLLIMPCLEGGRSRDVLIGCSKSSDMDALLRDLQFLSFRDPETDIVF